MADNYLKKISSILVLVLLIALAFFILKPILLAIIFGLILAFVFYPVYNTFIKGLKSQNLTALIVCLILIVIVMIPLWFLAPIILEESFKIYVAAQQIDLITPLREAFPSFFISDAFSSEIGATINSFINNSLNFLINKITDMIFDLPTIMLQLFVVLFTMFFALRDKDFIIDYLKSLMPFSKNIQKKLFDSSKAITSSVIYGQILIGMFQGLIAGLGFFIFGVPSALLLTIFAMLGGILPIVGTFIVWVPVTIYLFISGSAGPAWGVLVFGILSSSVDNILRPIFVSRRTNLSEAVVLAGMVGGLFLFGVIGLILGPLILAYLLIILEVYRDKGDPTHLVQQQNETKS